ncbi:MAG: transcriptional activator NhaR [Methylococcaceae bacterium]|jgi:LysR family transcriptional activator of nhaA|nr:transcriptional activator NhaR [Methylococcaceae bacterium]MDZ4158055.1 transcriptional activator NhaR [Methylococcales bacterium]MDP2392846.1 transcriptional activator NhaR [Methylococcaceae bacterium]MDP3020374.1 transcriptional activator NhaR [Methylococcaceae bacterium]MDP3391981.1 transcriptional activator NhaR [Methylococcaceae bacterium]
MERINYQHLYYFWNVVKEDGITRACEKLHLAQPTISGQLAVFEQAIGEKLFYKNGRKLELTDTGRVVFGYADEIFSLGQELTNTLKGRPTGRALRLVVGVADALPKLVVYRLIKPAFAMEDPVQVLCYEDKAERLLADIAVKGLDLVLSDVPLTPVNGVNAFNHFLGECPVAVFGTPLLAKKYRPDFPRSLNGAPFLLPTGNTALRRSLDQWFDVQGIIPNIQAEIEDSALVKTFGSGGAGLFVASATVEAEIQRQYDVEMVGRIEDVHERFYAVTVQRKLEHSAVTAILDNARERLF